MSEVTFGRLTDLLPREAWSHEEHVFTPWLAANIDQLSEAIGIPLELTGREIAVEAFSADLLARNPSDGTVVLIENQLEVTDHTHLGQIMTYLAGLQAQTVIWIAPRFREPHLSAIRWLNEHTADGFSFFAVRLRVVRIGDSPYAPIFEVVEKPNDWDRLVDRIAQPTTKRSEVGDLRRRFWTAFVERYPGDAEQGINANATSSCWMELFDGELVVSIWIGGNRVGLFVRGPWGAQAGKMLARLMPHAERLSEQLEAPFGTNGNALFGRQLKVNLTDAANWPEAIDWLHREMHRYRTVLTEIVGERPDGQ